MTTTRDIMFGRYEPDASANAGESGRLTQCQDVVPTYKGYRHKPVFSALAGVSALAAQCRGAAALAKSDGTIRLFAGTQTKLYELVGTTWTDRSAGGGSYTGSATNRWSLAQFGDISLASNDTENIQQSSSGAFAAIANAPKARIVIAVPNFAVAFNTQDGSASTVFGDSPDRWWCSAYQAATDWAINATNQCVSERIVGGGEFTAAAPFGTGWVAYKRRQMVHAYYSGDAAVFTTQRVPGAWGCVGPDAVADIDGAHFVVGEDDIFIYDGARPVSVCNGSVRSVFFTQIGSGYKQFTSVRYERATGLVWVFVPFATPTNHVTVGTWVYHLTTGRWATGDQGGHDASFVYASSTGVDTIGLFENSTNLAGTFTGTPSGGSNGQLTLGWFGTNAVESVVNKVQFIADSHPSVANMYHSTRKPDATGVSAIALSSGAFDTRKAAYWHQLRLVPFEVFEVGGITVHAEGPAGRGR